MKPGPGLITDDYILSTLKDNGVVAVGVSGGKDSCAIAIAMNTYLNAIDYTGPRILIHSDLGRVEWKESLPTCQRLAKHIGWELVVVRRKAGDMMDRWHKRWENNVHRYTELECVKLILPWSTPSMRFCTAELKRDVICRELVTRFPGKVIFSVSGIRREESDNRKKANYRNPQIKMTNKKWDTIGWDWHPLLDWTLEEVLKYLDDNNFPLHEAYTKYGTSRVSCAFCIMSKHDDLVAASTCEDNADIYREMVDLEIRSTFSFQSSKWLGDIAPHLLTRKTVSLLAKAKDKALQREESEARIPENLLYTKGWPTCIPTKEEATILVQVRNEISQLCDIPIKYPSVVMIQDRYKELFYRKKKSLL